MTEYPNTATEVSTEPIPMVDLRGQYHALKDEIDDAVNGVLESTRFIKGPVVAAFETDLAEFLGGGYALGVGNGTDALLVALMALEVGPGDEVITPAFSFVAAAEMIRLVGARPVFADIDPLTFNIDPAHAATLVTDKTVAIIPVHLYGQAADMTSIMKLARERDLYVIEDNAQAIGARHRGEATGYIGDIGCLSFFPSKNLGCYGDGGAVLTRNPDLHQRMTELANHGARKKYRNDRVGLNSRLDAVQAAILGVKLRHLQAFTRARQEVASVYDELLAGCAGIQIPSRDPNGTHVFHQYTIRVEGAAARRDALASFLQERGIAHSVYYPHPIYRFDAYADGLRDSTALPHTETACEQVLSLPMFPELTPAQQERVVDVLRSFLTIRDDE